MQSFLKRTLFISTLAAISALPMAGPCRADIYAFVDSNGVRHISNVPDDPRYRLVMRTPTYQKPASATPVTHSMVPSAGSYLTGYPMVSGGGGVSGKRKPFRVNEDTRERLAAHIAWIAGQHRLDPALLHAVISAESAFDPQAVSRTGAMGLMQLMPATAERFGVVNAFDPVANIHGGARYLRVLLDQFNNLTLALAAYNAGEGAVARYGNAIPPYQETQTYVARVLDFYNHYRN